jgi:hypothetical protein
MKFGLFEHMDDSVGGEDVSNKRHQQHGATKRHGH